MPAVGPPPDFLSISYRHLRHSRLDTTLTVSPMCVELFDGASKHVFIMGICARRDCGADTGGGSQPPPKPLIDGDTQETASQMTTTSTGSRPPGHDLAFRFREASGPPHGDGGSGRQLVHWLSVGEHGENTKEKDIAKKLPPPPSSHPSAPSSYQVVHLSCRCTRSDPAFKAQRHPR